MGSAWPELCAMIRRCGNAELNALLDKYQRKLFSGGKTCWVRSARIYIMRRASALGIVDKEAFNGDQGQT